MSKLKFLFLSLLVLSIKSFASDLNVSLDELEVKEEVARSLGLNAQQIEIAPAAIEYAKADSKDGVGLKGRLFITWSVRDTLQTDDSMKYTNSGVTITSQGTNLDGSAKGKITNSVKLGYQLFEHLGVEAGYEKTSSDMEVSSMSSGSIIGTMSSGPFKIHNEFQSVKLGLVTNANLIDAKSFRMDLVGGVNGGLIMANSTYKTEGDVYNGAIGYSYGAEASVRVIHKSGLYVSTGVGMNNKVLAPMTYRDGSQSQFNGSEKYVFINVGYSFGGKKRR